MIDLSFAIIALNEEERIEKLIDSLKLLGKFSILLLDGGSDDKTRELAAKCNISVEFMPNSSIEERRRMALVKCSTTYICFIDADQLLSSEINLSRIIQRFTLDKKLAGVQFSLRAIGEVNNYWTKGFAIRHNIITGSPGKRNVIGTPCIFKVASLCSYAYQDHITGPSDDTMCCLRIRKAGYKLEAIEEHAYEYVRSSLGATIRKAIWYGHGDAEYVKKVGRGKELFNHLYHVFIRMPILHPAYVIVRKPIFFPFMVIFGCVRLYGFIHGSIYNYNLSSDKS